MRIGFAFASVLALCACAEPAPEPSGLSFGLDASTHARSFPVAIGDVHALDTASAGGVITCTSCHDGELTRCAACHTAQQPDLRTRHAAVRDFGNDDALCLRCHADSDVYPTLLHLPFRIRGGDHDREPCFDCHRERRDDKPWAQDFTKSDCRRCHSESDMNREHRGERDYVRYDEPACISCHPDGQKP